MKELSITFSSEILHENSFSWSFGAVVGDECRDLRFVEPSNPEFSAIQLGIRNGRLLPEGWSVLPDRISDRIVVGPLQIFFHRLSVREKGEKDDGGS